MTRFSLSFFFESGREKCILCLTSHFTKLATVTLWWVQSGQRATVCVWVCFIFLNEGISYLCKCAGWRRTLAQLAEYVELQKWKQGLTRTFLGDALLLCFHQVWSFCWQTGLLRRQSRPADTQHKQASVGRRFETTLTADATAALYTYVLFLSTIFFTLIARCSEYSLHTPWKTSARVHDYWFRGVWWTATLVNSPFRYISTRSRTATLCSLIWASTSCFSATETIPLTVGRTSQTQYDRTWVARLKRNTPSLRSCLMASEHVLMKIWASWSIWSRSLSVMQVRSEEKRLENTPEGSALFTRQHAFSTQMHTHQMTEICLLRTLLTLTSILPVNQSPWPLGSPNGNTPFHIQGWDEKCFLLTEFPCLAKGAKATEQSNTMNFPTAKVSLVPAFRLQCYQQSYQNAPSAPHTPTPTLGRGGRWAEPSLD